MVNVMNCGMSDFQDKTTDKKIVCFGAGKIFDSFYRRNTIDDNYKFFENIEFIIDNNKSLYESLKQVNEKEIPIISLSHFLNLKYKKDYVILITNIDFLDEILNQLDREDALDGVECYISVLLERYREKNQKIEFTKDGNPKIPKKIHYCWFGGAPIPAHLSEFMESWSKFCPDYEIVRWDESNYDITKNLYMKQAYETKKWAFASDYARLDIIYNHGGIYLDTDVEILKSFDDLLYDNMFCGFERNNIIAFGLGFGAVEKHPLVKAIAEQYERIRFIHHDGSLNLTSCTIYQSMALKSYGFHLNDRHQIINGVAVYPTEVLCPKSFYGIEDNFSENTHSIHHFDASWIDKDEKEKEIHKGKRIIEMINKRNEKLNKKLQCKG